ncbi:MAG: SOS response-associated peptidase [Planctomycetes bacterium]|nr:SOS response-associated peptidase [Planctomycetota bacterium]
MCGRFNLRTPTAQLVEIFGVGDVPRMEARYNIAPTQPIAVVRIENGRRRLALVHWGLIPSWADDPKIGNRMINARAETAATKPAFRSAFKRRRCLVPADGFYEWKKTAGSRKQPYHLTTRDGRPFAMAGLWECWNGKEGDQIESCTILTTAANELVRPLHDRMPVILPPPAWEHWLDPEVEDADELQGLLASLPPDQMQAVPVSTAVNNPKHDTPQCLEPLAEQGTLFGPD